MKRIWFVQQKNLNINYLPLRWGLGQYTNSQIETLSGLFKPDAPDNPKNKYCPKLYTTRTHSLSGEYYVVEGSRFKATPVEPRIEFQVRKVAKLNLHGVLEQQPGHEFDFYWKTFPAQDLGVRGTTFEQLRDELLRLNPKATIDTPFYVNKLEPICLNLK